MNRSPVSTVSICWTKPSALPSPLNDDACILTASGATDHLAAENLTFSDEQYVQEASTYIGLRSFSVCDT